MRAGCKMNRSIEPTSLACARPFSREGSATLKRSQIMRFISAAATLTLLSSAVPSPSGGADFNADGHADLAVGVPFYLAAPEDVGAVNVLYGSAGGLTSVADQMWAQHDLITDLTEDEDSFGDALAAGDFNGDGAVDLAVGCPGETIGTQTGAGAVQVLYGVRGVGLSAAGSQFWHQDSPGIGGGAEEGDYFGFSLGVGDFNGDGFDDLAVGVPYEDITTVGEAGAFHVIYGGTGGLTEIGDQVWWRGENDLPGAVQFAENLGYALVAGDFDGDGFDDLAVSSPGANPNSLYEAGRVAVLFGAQAGLSAVGSLDFVQGWHGVPDVAEEGDRFGEALVSGDFNGDGFADLSIGAPREDWNTATDSGAFVMLYGSAEGPTSTGSVLVGDREGEASDLYSYSMAAGDLNDDGYDDLIVGIPSEDLGTTLNAGALEIMYGSSIGIVRRPGLDIWHQDSVDVLDDAEQGDHFGLALATGDFNNDGFVDVAVGVPHEDLGSVVDAGAVQVLLGSAEGVTATGNQFWNQDSPDIEGTAQIDANFGDALASLPRTALIFADGFESSDASRWSSSVP